MISKKLSVASVLLLAVGTALSKDKTYPKAKVSFEDFKSIVAEVEPQRAKRLIGFDAFLHMSQEPNTIILDTRSTLRYDRIHLKGAKHLSFTDFTQDNLQKVIPSFDTRILIYCNNNFEGNEVDFASKIALPFSASSGSAAAQFKAQEKPRMMALNVPTYINLYGYGYRNVYELDELVDVKDPRVVFEGSLVSGGSSFPPLNNQ